MKKFFAIFTAVILMPASQTMAWTGGPFSNDSPLTTGDDGVYEAMATMSNGVGLFRFGVRNTGTSTAAAGGFGGTGGGAATASSNVQFNAGLINAFSSNVWYYKGIVYYGTAFGIANSQIGIVSAVGNATTSSGSVVPNPALGQIVTPSINGQVVAGPTGNNIGFANSSFVAKIRDKTASSLRFSGTGEVSFVGAADVVARVEAINPVVVTAGGQFTDPAATLIIATNGAGGDVGPGAVVTTSGVFVRSQDFDLDPTTGLPLTNDQTTSSTFDSAVVQGEAQRSFASDTRVGTGGEDSAFPQRGHVRKFLVFGTRVSTVVSP